MKGCILITGGSGFMGAYVARNLLAEGRRVVSFDVRPLSEETSYVLGTAASAYEYERGGVEDWGHLLATVRRLRPDAIIHSGAIVDPRWLSQHPLPAFVVNAGGTVNVLEAARLFDVSRVVFLSSIGVLPTAQSRPIRVNHPLVLEREGPSTGFYGAAKVAGEVFGLAYHSDFGLDFRVVRPSAPYGFAMGFPLFVKPMVEGAVRGIPVRLPGGGRFPRSYTFIEDLTSLIVAVLDAPDSADRVFYGAHGGALTTAAQVATLVRELIPSADIEIGDVLSEAEQMDMRSRAPLSVDNARRQLKWIPKYVDMRSGLAEYIERYRGFLARSSSS